MGVHNPYDGQGLWVCCYLCLMTSEPTFPGDPAPHRTLEGSPNCPIRPSSACHMFILDLCRNSWKNWLKMQPESSLDNSPTQELLLSKAWWDFDLIQLHVWGVG